jgi:hypothetical protein
MLTRKSAVDEHGSGVYRQLVLEARLRHPLQDHRRGVYRKRKIREIANSGIEELRIGGTEGGKQDDRGRKSEVGDQRTDDGGQRSEVRDRRTGGELKITGFFAMMQ